MSINPPPTPTPLTASDVITPTWALWFTQLVAEANAALTGPVSVANGGTNLTGYMAGDIPYASALNVLARLAIGAAGTILTSNGTIPVWGGALNVFTLAGQPTLTAAEAGYLGFVSDYAHMVYFDGTNWQWADGDRPGQFADYAEPPGMGWALCDGSATTVLVVGGSTLTTVAFTTPNLAGTPSYKKSAAAYTGTLNAASGSTGAGTTSATVTGTGTSGLNSASTGYFHNTGNIADIVLAPDGHFHAVPALTIPALPIPALGVGSLDMPNLAVLPYVRR